MQYAANAKERVAMRYAGALLVVSDMETSRRFYEEVFGLEAISDYGENVAFPGFALQTDFLNIIIGREDLLIRVQSNDHELFFEEDDLDRFVAHLSTFPEIVLLHEVKEHPWGQRAIRFYDPDFHILEVGESMAYVVKRLREQGMSVAEVAEKTMQSEVFVEKHAK